jgi:hypothetical protein
MSDRIRIIEHEAVPQCGSFEVRFPDDRPSQYFYWDDLPSRRLRPETLDRETALEQAKAVARAAQRLVSVRVRASVVAANHHNESTARAESRQGHQQEHSL